MNGGAIIPAKVAAAAGWGRNIALFSFLGGSFLSFVFGREIKLVAVLVELLFGRVIVTIYYYQQYRVCDHGREMKLGLAVASKTSWRPAMQETPAG